MHRQHRVEKMGQADTVRFGDQSEERAVAIEAPWAAMFRSREVRFVVAV